MRLLLEQDLQKLWQSLGSLPEPVVRPAFIVVSGLPGTGKTHFCQQLRQRLSAIILESDALRKILFPQPTYSPKESSYLFRLCHLLIDKLLSRGIPVILDATNLSERNREFLYSIAEKQKAKLILVRVEAPPDVVKERLQSRRYDPQTKSDADWEVYQRMKSSVDRIRRQHLAVDTSRDITPVIEKIVKEVEDALRI